MEILKNINLYNLVKLLVITLSIILIPLMALRKILEKIKNKKSSDDHLQKWKEWKNENYWKLYDI